MIEASGLRFAWPGEPPLLADWSARVGPGVTQLYGDTGSGKSTLLRILAGELPADAARLAMNGVALDAAPERYRQQLFFVDPATPGFDPLTARDCLARWSGDTADAALCEQVVEGFGLLPHLDKAMYMLSTGSRRKVGLAAALAAGRPVTLLDEPTAALDLGSARCLWQALAQIGQQGRRCVLVASSEQIDAVPLAATLSL